MFVLARQIAASIPAGLGRVVSGLGQSQALVHLIGKLRRLYLVTFRRRYVRRQIALRAGLCRQCGRCCALCFTCPALATDRSCLIYGKWRPRSCVAFPIDRRDLDDVRLTGGACGYYFPDAQDDQQTAPPEQPEPAESR